MGILEGKITGERAKMMLETYEMQFDAPYYVVAMLYADTNPKEVRGKTVQLLTLSLKDMAQDYLNERLRFYSAIYLDEVILVLWCRIETVWRLCCIIWIRFAKWEPEF